MGEAAHARHPLRSVHPLGLARSEPGTADRAEVVRHVGQRGREHHKVSGPPGLADDAVSVSDHDRHPLHAGTATSAGKQTGHGSTSSVSGESGSINRPHSVSIAPPGDHAVLSRTRCTIPSPSQFPISPSYENRPQGIQLYPRPRINSSATESRRFLARSPEAACSRK